MRSSLLSLLTVSCLFISSSAFALISGEALIGTRSISFDNAALDDQSGSEVKLSVMLDPIPLVPVGFGAYMSTTDYKSGTLVDFSGNEMGVFLSAWSPIELLGLTPYAKISYTLLGSYSATLSGDSVDLDPSGTRLAAGLQWSPLPLVALALEVEQSNIEFDIEGGTSQKSSGLGILVGAQVGI